MDYYPIRTLLTDRSGFILITDWFMISHRFTEKTFMLLIDRSDVRGDSWDCTAAAFWDTSRIWRHTEIDRSSVLININQ